MRLVATGAVAIMLAAMLSACVERDIQDPAERAAAGALIGSALGAGIGATFSTIPPAGAIGGAEIGAGVGAIAGVLTTPPAPSYTPVAAPVKPIPPGFYDTWPPGFGAPPANPETQSPHAG